jgi:hypothetical protein
MRSSLKRAASARSPNHDLIKLVCPLCQAGSDVVEQAIVGQAGDKPSGHDGDTAEAREANDDFDILAASEWPGIPKDRVLLSPAQCRTHWRQFASDSSVIVQQAMSAQVRRVPPLPPLPRGRRMSL